MFCYGSGAAAGDRARLQCEDRMAAFLVTGGCGFIGSHLCEALIGRGDRVRVLDDLSTGKVANVPPQTEIVRGDVADPPAVEAAMAGVAGCFHLAAIASVERSMCDWLGTHRTNLTGTIAVFDAARRSGQNGPIPVVYASSAAIYGDCADLPIREDAPARPCSPYGADKLACELHGRVACEAFGVPTVGLRLFNVYGPRQDPKSPYSGVISIFCDRLRQGQPIDVFGDGSQTRDFIFVADVVRAFLAAMDHPQSPAVYNVCSGMATSVLQLAQVIGDVCGRSPDIRFSPPRNGEVAHSLGDRSLIRARLGLPEPIDLRSGLTATLASVRL
jgi:UDP-glucose 4-epimerase